MNKRQKIVQEAFLDNEEAVIKRLKQVYGKSLSDITAKAERLQKEFEELSAEYDTVEDEAEREILKSRMQSKVYQKKYQEGLKKQVDDILNDMQEKEYKTVSDYLNQCYEEGFVGAMYDLQGQGIPMCFPLDQEAMVQAVQLDSPISQGLYSRLGEDVSMLKKKITAQVSRGIATGMTYAQVAKQLSGYTNIGFNNAVRIARTEGHRIQVQSAMNACYNARDKGAEVVKQWDSTLDAKTRESHAMVDREIKELDEKFSNGLMYPGDPSGGAAEVVNCRCALLQRARWALEGGFTKMNNFTKQLEEFESPEDYADFKKAFFSKENRNYMNYVEKMENKYNTKDFQKVLEKMSDQEYNHYSKLLGDNQLFNWKKKSTSKTQLTNNTKYGKMGVKSYADAKTIGEAKDYANNILGLTCSGYETMNLNVANTVNREIQAIYNIFGDVNKGGHLNGLRIMTGKQSYVAAYSPPLKEILLKKSNVGYKTSLSKMKKDAKVQFDLGFWSTDAAEQSIRHELGHAIQHMYTDSDIGFRGMPTGKLKKISDMRKDILNSCGITKWSMQDTTDHLKAAGDKISYYALKSDGEFIAESVAEYMAGNPRETAKKVVEILLNGR